MSMVVRGPAGRCAMGRMPAEVSLHFPCHRACFHDVTPTVPFLFTVGQYRSAVSTYRGFKYVERR